jgi:hypothetical protein
MFLLGHHTTVRTHALHLISGKTASTLSPALWPELIAFAAEQQVLAALGELALIAAPCPVGPLLQFFVQEGQAEAEQQFAALAETTRRLESAGVAVVALKGAAFLAQGLRTRTMVDLDLLVEKANLAAACEVLLLSGYRSDPAHEAVHVQHAPPLFSPNGVMIELHHVVAAGRVRNPLPTRAIFDFRMQFARQGVAIQAPCPEHRLVHLITHAMLSNKGARLYQLALRDLLDLHQLTQVHAVDWAIIRELFEQSRQIGAAAAFLTAAHRLLGPILELPAWALEGGSWADRAIEAFFDPSRYRLRRYVGQLRCDLEAIIASGVYRQHAVRSLHPARWPRHLRRYLSLR